MFADYGDILSASPATEWSLEIIGPFARGLSSGADNLVSRAVQTFASGSTATAVRFVLDKRLPVAAGLGGGSADAAAAVRLLRRLGVADHHASGRAVSLGADVPVCLYNRAARVAGIGQALSPAPDLPPFGLALVNPGVPVSTAAVFQARAAPFSRPATLPSAWADVATLAADLLRTRNDLQPPAVAAVPAIAEALQALATVPGCRLARMSGSGATCFGLFDAPDQARLAAASIRRPGWWAWGGGVSGQGL